MKSCETKKTFWNEEESRQGTKEKRDKNKKEMKSKARKGKE